MPKIIALSVRQIPKSLFQVLPARSGSGGASTDALKNRSPPWFDVENYATRHVDLIAPAVILVTR